MDWEERIKARRLLIGPRKMAWVRSSIANATKKYSTKMNSLGKLQSFQITKRKEVKFNYRKNDFLLESVAFSNGDLFVYEYSAVGSVMRAIGPTGESFALTMDPNCLTGIETAGLCLIGHRNGRLVLNITSTAEGERHATG